MSELTDPPLDLVARLEAATEGSRELDAAIYVATHGWTALSRYAHLGWVRRGAIVVEAPRYTTSLDAALTLVLEGMSDAESKTAALATCIAALKIRAAGKGDIR